jgi:hypothetical protein
LHGDGDDQRAIAAVPIGRVSRFCSGYGGISAPADTKRSMKPLRRPWAGRPEKARVSMVVSAVVARSASLYGREARDSGQVRNAVPSRERRVVEDIKASSG